MTGSAPTRIRRIRKRIVERFKRESDSPPAMLAEAERLLKPRTRERFLFDTLLGIADRSVLETQAAAEEGPRELAETRAGLKVAEQLRIEEREHKQAS